MERSSIRINKYLSEAGVCSRRGADKLIEAGRVLIDGNLAEIGSQVMEGQKVTVDGKAVYVESDRVLLVFHKPKGIVCTAEEREKNNIIRYLNYPKRIFPIGRLDKDSEGLLLLTNDGDLGDRIARARNHHEKEYIVTVNKEITPEFLRKMSEGIPILDTVTRPCQIEKLDKRKFKIILTQGLNRQIRRMCEYCGYRVVKLVRVRIMNIRLNDLKEGTYRELSSEEWNTLLQMLQEDRDGKRGNHGSKAKN